MYKPKILLFGNEQDNLVVLEETGYVAESALQEFLAAYPDLLPGDQIDPENPRRWLLVAREMGVPAETGEAGRWSLDHLFLDQDGTPTFVECKRASDTRARREVVAQMLDYAANGLEYWNVERLRQVAAETAKNRGSSLDQEITRLLGDEEADIEEYWKKVEQNLQEHRVRLVFVMDSTPRELRRLVEFLNEEMRHVEVLVVEVKQFQGAGGQKVLIPRVLGLTENARSRKETLSSPRKIITYEEFMSTCTPEAQEFFQRVLDVAEKKGYIICWRTLGFSVRLRLPNGLATFVYGFPPNVFQFYFDRWMRGGEEFLFLRQKLLAFGLFKESGEWTLSAWVNRENLAQMNEVYDFILEEIEKFGKAFTM